MSQKATQEILKMVRSISKKTPGGEAFFDALDEKLSSTKNKWLIGDLISKVPKGASLVLSGGFGLTVSTMMMKGDLSHIPYVVFAGGVRSGKEPTVICETKGFDDGGKFFFLDDSIYGGATYYKIKDHLKSSRGIEVECCWVIYDGCPVVREDVKSLFRYYDFFKKKPNYTF